MDFFPDIGLEFSKFHNASSMLFSFLPSLRPYYASPFHPSPFLLPPPSIFVTVFFFLLIFCKKKISIKGGKLLFSVDFAIFQNRKCPFYFSLCANHSCCSSAFCFLFFIFVHSFTSLLGNQWSDFQNRKNLFVNFAKDKGFDPLVADNWYQCSSGDYQKIKVRIGGHVSWRNSLVKS